MTVCPICNGRGTVGYFHIDHFVDIECDRCHGRGEVSEVEMTNEEWLRTAATEQLAEEIVKMTLLDKYKLYDRMESAEYDIGIGVGAKKVIAEWLKQPHTNKE